MGLEINANQQIAGLNSNFLINPIRTGQRPYSQPVSFNQKPDYLNTSSDLIKYANEKTIVDMIKANPKIMQILKANGIKPKIHMQTLNGLLMDHLPKTRQVAVGIANNLPKEYQAAIHYGAIQKAAILHDFGKALIPLEILNKNGKLSPQEQKIMQLHSILGYELLKTTDLDKKTLELIKYHHQNPNASGYPKVDDYFISDLNSQIISASDMYTAIREKRSYKPALNKNQALYIIHQEMKKGNIHPIVFKALVDYANKSEIENAKLLQINTNRHVKDFESVNSLRA